MFRNGEFVMEHVTPAWYYSAEEYEVNPTGVDITLGTIDAINDQEFVMTRDTVIEPSSYEVGHRKTKDDVSVFSVDEGYYFANYQETIEIPDGHVGFVMPRSTLMRNGVMLFTAVWDAGYEGKGGGGMLVSNNLTIEKGTRIGQLLLAKAEDSDVEYDGTYQGEGIEDGE